MNKQKRVSIKILMLCLGLSLTSCVDFIEEIFLNKDGSGVFQYTLACDLASPAIMLGMESEGFSDFMEKKDSVFFFRDLPDSIRRDFTSTTYLDRVIINMKHTAENKMVLRFDFPFSRIEEINKLRNEYRNAGSDNLLQKNKNIFNYSIELGISKKTLKRETKFSQLTSDDPYSQFVMKMLENSSIRTIYHFKSKIKNTSIPYAAINGNDVVIVSDFSSFRAEKVSQDGLIVLK